MTTKEGLISWVSLVSMGGGGGQDKRGIQDRIMIVGGLGIY